jgi:glucose-1-phosphate cytidylyltransferase
MIEIGEMPILWHIMKIYSHFGYNEFIICLGYKGYVIKEFFSDYFLYTSDVTFDMAHNEMTVHNSYSEPWKVTLVNTGLYTGTGGRIKRIKDYIGQETFLMTYGDGVANVDIKESVQYHKTHGKLATMCTVRPAGRFGALEMGTGNVIEDFREKRQSDGSWINGGFMVLEPDVFEYIQNDDVFFEQEPLVRLAAERELMAFRHEGFWQCMDTQRDKHILEELWNSGCAPWKMW